MGVQGTEIRSKGQGELHRWVYSAQRGAEAARESCTDGCTDHKEALKKMAVQRASWSSEGHLGAPIGCTGHKETTKRLQVAPKRLQS